MRGASVGNVEGPDVAGPTDGPAVIGAPVGDGAGEPKSLAFYRRDIEAKHFCVASAEDHLNVVKLLTSMEHGMNVDVKLDPQDVSVCVSF